MRWNRSARRLPVTTRFLPYGHKLGFGLVGAAALDAQRAPATARLAAWDVVRYDQQGCYSPHVFYVERGGRVSPREFAQYLAARTRQPAATASRAGPCRWKMRRRSPAGASGVELQALSPAAGGDELIGEDGAAWAVAYTDAAAGAGTHGVESQRPGRRGRCAGLR